MGAGLPLPALQGRYPILTLGLLRRLVILK